MLIDTGFLKRVTSANPKPEVKLRLSVRHLENRYNIKTLPTMVRFGWNSTSWCRMTCHYSDLVEIDTGSRIRCCKSLIAISQRIIIMAALESSLIHLLRTTNSGLTIFFVFFLVTPRRCDVSTQFDRSKLMTLRAWALDDISWHQLSQTETIITTISQIRYQPSCIELSFKNVTDDTLPNVARFYVIAELLIRYSFNIQSKQKTKHLRKISTGSVTPCRGTKYRWGIKISRF